MLPALWRLRALRNLLSLADCSTRLASRWFRARSIARPWLLGLSSAREAEKQQCRAMKRALASGTLLFHSKRSDRINGIQRGASKGWGRTCLRPAFRWSDEEPPKAWLTHARVCGSFASTSSKSSGELRRSRHCRRHSFSSMKFLLFWLLASGLAQLLHQRSLFMLRRSSSLTICTAFASTPPRPRKRQPQCKVREGGGDRDPAEPAALSMSEPATSRRHLDNSRLPFFKGMSRLPLATSCPVLLESHEERSAPKPQSADVCAFFDAPQCSESTACPLAPTRHGPVPSRKAEICGKAAEPPSQGLEEKADHVCRIADHRRVEEREASATAVTMPGSTHWLCYKKPCSQPNAGNDDPSRRFFEQTRKECHNPHLREPVTTVIWRECATT